MVKRKIADAVTQDDESFEWKSKLISTSTKKTIKFNDFLQLIEDDKYVIHFITDPKEYLDRAYKCYKNKICYISNG